MSLKPWREIAIPHEDVRKGTFQQSEFAADLSLVHSGKASLEYQNPQRFFQRTFITEGMRLLLDSVIRRLAGKGGDPVIQLQTAFGGGKTHTMMAVYHLAKGDAKASDLQGIPPILDAAGILNLPRAKIAVIDGIQYAPNQPKSRDNLSVRTLWGDLAWQLGGVEGYAMLADSDASGTSPGKAILANLLERYAPCVILMDELVTYIRQFEEGKVFPGGSFDSNLSFVQALTEAMKAVSNSVLLASLPESDKEAGGRSGVKSLTSLSHCFGRIQALWKPVGTEEAFEIVRRRLFSDIKDQESARQVCRRFADFYTANPSAFPHETQEGRYFDRLINAYPIHPEVFARLYEDWSSLDHFQRTRGVLKLMAKVIYRLWANNDKDPLIMPGTLPLQDYDTRNEILYYLPQGWDPIVQKDIDGENAETTAIDNREDRFGSVQACRRVARTIFLGSAPGSTNQVARGIEPERILLGVAQPDQQIGVYKDARTRLEDRLHYLNRGNNRYWFDTRPNLRREMEDRRSRFQKTDLLVAYIRDLAQKSFSSAIFAGIHVFTSHQDVPDDNQLRLIVLSPDQPFSIPAKQQSKTESAQKEPASLAISVAGQILQKRGEQPRAKQNRLLFLAADMYSVDSLKDHVCAVLAWKSIQDDAEHMKLNLDQIQMKEVTKNLDQAKEASRRMLCEAYKWLLVPRQELKSDKPLSELIWEHHSMNPGVPASQEFERVLKEDESLIVQWAPFHLANMLKKFFWKDGVKAVSAKDIWEQTCKYLYLPRLKDEKVFQRAIEVGMGSYDFFGLAQGQADGCYLGFSFGRQTSFVFDSALLLIEPGVAFEYTEALRQAEEAASRNSVTEPFAGKASAGEISLANVNPDYKGDASSFVIQAPIVSRPKTRFYASIELEPILAKRKFATMVDEILQNFTIRPDITVKINIEIEATTPKGFDESLQRTIKENSTTLGIKTSSFEES